jgi:hypothetical protein
LGKEVDEYAKTVGQLTVENNWMRGKLKDLDLSNKLAMVDEADSTRKRISLTKVVALTLISF